MFLVELVMQGVRGFRDLARLRFTGGFNLVAAGNETGKTTAVDAIQRMLFPINRPERMEALISRYVPDASRGALVVFSDEGAYFRVIQDFSKRAVNLSGYNAATKEFTLLHKDWENTTQFMTKLTAGISEDDYASIFILRREHYEARLAPAAPSATPPPSRPVGLHKDPAPVAPRSDAQESRLTELRETLRKAEEAADADYKWQSAKLRVEELTKKIAFFDQMDKKAADMEANLESLKNCAALPENLNELLEAHERLQRQNLEDTKELKEQIESLRIQREHMPTANFMMDKLFIMGVVLGVLSVIAGLFVLTTEQAEYFPIGVLVSLVLVAIAWYNSTRKNAQLRVIEKDIEAQDAVLADLEKNFAKSGSEITSYMQTTGAATTGELREKVENYRYFCSLRDELEEQRQRSVGDFSRGALEEEILKQQFEANELENSARAIAEHAVDTYSVRQEIERIESERSVRAPLDFGQDMQDFPTDFSAPSVSGNATRAGFFAELGIAIRIGGIEADTLIPAVEAAAQRNFSVVTAGRYVRIEVGHEGEPVVHDKDDSKANCSDLSHGTRALLYFCLRAGLVEALVGKLRMPFVLDDPLSGFDPTRQNAACQVLRTLGSKTQVVLFTANPALRMAGDAAAELK